MSAIEHAYCVVRLRSYRVVCSCGVCISQHGRREDPDEAKATAEERAFLEHLRRKYGGPSKKNGAARALDPAARERVGPFRRNGARSRVRGFECSLADCAAKKAVAKPSKAAGSDDDSESDEDGNWYDVNDPFVDDSDDLFMFEEQSSFEKANRYFIFHGSGLQHHDWWRHPAIHG